MKNWTLPQWNSHFRDGGFLRKWVDRYAITKVIIAFPSASSKRIRSVAEAARSIGLVVDSVPALTDLVSGRFNYANTPHRT